MNTLTQDRVYGAMAGFLLALAWCYIRQPEWFGWALLLTMWAVTGAFLGGTVHRHKTDRAAARAQDEAQLARAESVLLAMDDSPPEPPPAIPVEMRDSAFQQHAEARRVMRAPGSTGKEIEAAHRILIEAAHRILLRPLVAERRFTATTHCPAGHVATHWLGRTTTTPDDEPCVERVCRFEACSATWLERT